MFKRFRNFKIKPLLIHLIITIAYPAARALTAENNRLTRFSDALTIIGGLLILVGLFYSFYLHGDFDRTAYVFTRGVSSKVQKPFDAYIEDKNKDREDAFNYPLCLGIVYTLVSLLISYIWF